MLLMVLLANWEVKIAMLKSLLAALILQMINFCNNIQACIRICLAILLVNLLQKPKWIRMGHLATQEFLFIHLKLYLFQSCKHHLRDLLWRGTCFSRGFWFSNTIDGFSFGTNCLVPIWETLLWFNCVFACLVIQHCVALLKRT